MNRLLIILIFMTIACSGEIVSSDQKLSESDLIENANQEISKLGKSIIDKNRIIDSLKKDIDLSNKSLDLLNKNIEELQSDFDELSNKHLNLIDHNKKLSEENLLLEISLRNLRTQYETSAIEKSVEKK
ncbi:MAG: hypothetical protein FI686_00220 [SAR202 cluster bacterium]|nr:hypothetical protein [SAR202 cluster bacterium]